MTTSFVWLQAFEFSHQEANLFYLQILFWGELHLSSQLANQGNFVWDFCFHFSVNQSQYFFLETFPTHNNVNFKYIPDHHWFPLYRLDTHFLHLWQWNSTTHMLFLHEMFVSHFSPINHIKSTSISRVTVPLDWLSIPVHQRLRREATPLWMMMPSSKESNYSCFCCSIKSIFFIFIAVNPSKIKRQELFNFLVNWFW